MTKPKTSSSKPTDNDVAIVRMTEMTVRVRWITCGLTVLGCFWIIKDGVVEVARSRESKTSWVQALEVLIPAVTSFSIPGFLLFLARRRIVQFTRRLCDRVTRLETSRDSERTSSGLMSDGTDPPGATP